MSDQGCEEEMRVSHEVWRQRRKRKESEDASLQTHLDPKMVEVLVDRLPLELRELEIDQRLMRRRLEEKIVVLEMLTRGRHVFSVW